MNSRECVLRTLEFDHPDRIPRQVWLLPVARYELGTAAVDAFLQRWPQDFTGLPGVDPRRSPGFRGDAYQAGLFTDEWGCTFENIQQGIIGEVKTPLIAQWSDLDRLRLPVEMLAIDADAVARAYAATDRFAFAGCCPRVFERLQFLRGTENLYMDLAEESPEMLELLQRVGDFYIREMEAWAHLPGDALMFMDDWGSQRTLLISPDQWRRLFKPLYRRFAQIAHQHGKKLFMHSDGYIFDIYEDLIEIGVDAINSQLFCMDIAEIGRTFRGRITFWGEIDRQHILPYGTLDEVRAAVQTVAEHLYTPTTGGGVIAQFELGSHTQLENAEEVFQTWDRLTRSSAVTGTRA